MAIDYQPKKEGLGRVDRQKDAPYETITWCVYCRAGLLTIIFYAAFRNSIGQCLVNCLISILDSQALNEIRLI